MAIVEDVPDEPSSAYTTAVCIWSSVQSQPATEIESRAHGQTQHGGIPLRRPPATSSSPIKPLLSVDPPIDQDELLAQHARAGQAVPEIEPNFAEEVFDTALLTVPFTFLYILLDL
jgi:hypothetical protein